MSRNQPSRESSGLMSWRGTLPWFSPMTEGGPGTPLSLGIQAALALSLGGYGVHRIETDGIDSFGPAMVVLACGWGLFLVVWLLIKGVLRGREVEFVLSEKGVEVRPSPRQQHLDRGMKVVSHAIFLLTYKGGQWSNWHPATRWKEVRHVEFDDTRRDIVLRGGAWTIRLVCGPDQYGPAAEIVREKVPARDKAPAKRPAASQRATPRIPAGPSIAAGPGGWHWLFRIGVPLVGLAAAAGVAAGAARWAVGFIPGIPGMVAGGVLAWLAGRCARREEAALWGGGQRFWLWINMVLTCGVVALATLSLLQAPPLAGPLEWLSDVANGFVREPFFGARAIDPIRGMLGGGWWIGFTMLDLVLFFFLGIVVLGATVQRRLAPGRPGGEEGAKTGAAESDVWGDDGEEEEDEGIALDRDDVVGTWSPPFARRWLVVQWAAVALVWMGLHAGGGRSPAMRYDPLALARLEALTGRFAFDDGRDLLAPAGTGGEFLVQAGGFHRIVVNSAPDGAYGMYLDGEGVDFRGRMYRGSTMVSVRVRFSKDGQSLRLVGPAASLGRRMGEVEIHARRMPEPESD